MNTLNLKYFLAANSCNGFVSEFDNCYDAKTGWKSYIIKGGPGTGKSSFMKFIAAKAQEKNIEILLCPCSSDPNSLDAIVLPTEKIVILDGTPPHIVEPIYPAVCEEIINLGSFWNKEILKGNEAEIIAITDKNRLLHKKASYYLQAAGRLLFDNLKTVTLCTNTEKVLSFAKTLEKKYLPKKGAASGKEWSRFLSGITPLGIVSFTNTVLLSAKKNIIISDEFGSVISTLMPYLQKKALEKGYEIITVKNPFLPEHLIDGIIIPELSISFIRESEYFNFKTEQRRIHSRRFIDTSQLSKNRNRIKFNKKVVHNLFLTAIEILADAKSIHDNLESYYVKAMDFEKLSLFAFDFTEKLFKNS